MVSMESAIQNKVVRVDTEGACGASFWTGHSEFNIDWNDDMLMMVIALDVEGKVIQWNKRAQELTEFTQQELTGYSFAHHLVSRSFSGLVDQVLQRTLNGEDVGCFQIPFYTKAGAKMRVVIHASLSVGDSSQHLLLKALTTDDVARRQVAGAHQNTGLAGADIIGNASVNIVMAANSRTPLEEAVTTCGSLPPLSSVMDACLSFSSEDSDIRP